MVEETPPEVTPEVEDGEGGTPPETEAETPPEEDTRTYTREEFQRAEVSRDKAKAELKALKAELKELRGEKDKPAEPSPEEKANAKLVKASARAALASVGVADRTVQGKILDVVRLDGIEVDEDGEVDEDALTEVFKVLADAFKPKTRTTVTARPNGSASGPTDPDAARYRRILGK